MFPFVRCSPLLNTHPMKMSAASPDFSAHSRRPGVSALLAVLVAAAVLSCLLLHRAIEFRTSSGANFFPVFDNGEPLHSDSKKYSLERVLKVASMPDNTVILTTLNEAWAAPNSVIDLFLESFRIGEGTRWLLNHLDADVMWFRNPFPHFHPDADFQIACDHFSGRSDDIENKPNGGFKFVRSNKRSIEFYKFWHASHELYPGMHDQDVLNKIKNDSFITEMGLHLRFLDTAYFGGFCEPSEDLDEVCTMHANCCFGLSSKLHDLRILLEDWKMFLSSSLSSEPSGWTVPQNCSLDSLHLDVQQPDPNRARHNLNAIFEE